jgi:hypothetical protein
VSSSNILKKLPLIFQVKTLVLFTKQFGIGVEQVKVLFKYLTASLFPEQSDRIHLDAAMSWLTHAQDVDTIDAGVSAAFYLKSGWDVSYPETSGYILATYLAYGELTNDSQYLKRAVAIGDWEIVIQAPNGGVYSNPTPGDTRVFNTGQVMLGWLLLFEQTGQQKYLDATISAGDYLKEEQKDDGSWVKDTYSGAKTYEARVDWALLRLAQLSGNSTYLEVAIRNLRWVLSKQNENGWFDSCGFHNELPIMHTIIYTLRGLLECELMDEEAVNELNLLDVVKKSVDRLCEAANSQFVKGKNGMIPRGFDENWNGIMSDSCLTGNAQFVILLYRLSHIVDDNTLYLTTADLVLSATKRTQIIDTSLQDLKGAVAGSYPIYQGYVHDAYPNWAAKFLADALLMKIGYEQGLVIKA